MPNSSATEAAMTGSRHGCRRTTIAALSILGGMVVLGTSASAADLGAPVYKAPVAPVVAPFSWTGLYVGGTVGAARTKADVTMSTANGTFPLYDPADIPSLNAFGSPSLSQTNAIFGAKAGYNQQWGSFVLGLEGDISSFHFNPTVANAGNPFVTFPGFGSAQMSTNVETSWLATIRGRVGFALDHWLLYGTGGVAFANVKYSNSYRAFSPHGFGFDFETATASQTRTGWAAGAGVDYALYPHVILSAEYLHVDLGTTTATGAVTTQAGPATATFNFSTKVTSDLVRVGAAYKF
jgi:outer membrane immunogenic protein